MMQYNLRLDDKTKQRASLIAKKKGVSENALYQTAIEEFLSKIEATEFYQKLLNRVVTPREKQALLKKLRSNKQDVLFEDDQR